MEGGLPVGSAGGRGGLCGCGDKRAVGFGRDWYWRWWPILRLGLGLRRVAGIFV